MDARTLPVEWLEKPHEGYVVNVGFSDENQAQLQAVVEKIRAEFGDAVYTVPADSLHITLLDWIAPLVEYSGRDKTKLFEEIYPLYDASLTEICASEKRFSVTFDTLHVSPTTIFMTGHDNGAFDRIRTAFISDVELLPGTKQPPRIIHSSLARFTAERELPEVESFVATLHINITQSIEAFRLVYTHKEPMLEYEVIKKYVLA